MCTGIVFVETLMVSDIPVSEQNLIDFSWCLHGNENCFLGTIFEMFELI